MLEYSKPNQKPTKAQTMQYETRGGGGVHMSRLLDLVGAHLLALSSLFLPTAHHDRRIANRGGNGFHFPSHTDGRIPTPRWRRGRSFAGVALPPHSCLGEFEMATVCIPCCGPDFAPSSSPRFLRFVAGFRGTAPDASTGVLMVLFPLHRNGGYW